MASEANLTLRLGVSLKKDLDKSARSTRRSQSRVAADAIRQYIEINRWQIAHIEKAVLQADSGDFLTEKEATAMFRKLTRCRAR